MVKTASLKWLEKANDDLSWTEANIREKVWYGACFTAQQAAEKALKAYLISRKKQVARIHDLGVLLELCKKFDLTFENLKTACATLTDYYLPARYPDISEFMTFSNKKSLEALELAKKIVEFVAEKI